MWTLHGCDKAENHVLKLEMRTRNTQPGTYGYGLQRRAWFCLWKAWYLNISPLRQEHRPFDVVPASSGQLQPGKCMQWAVCSNPSQITPRWINFHVSLIKWKFKWPSWFSVPSHLKCFEHGATHQSSKRLKWVTLELFRKEERDETSRHEEKYQGR